MNDESDPGDIGDYLRDVVENDIDETTVQGHLKSILYQFMSNVNWTEIAQHIRANSKG
jgi:predicted HD phosphohydrolase